MSKFHFLLAGAALLPWQEPGLLHAVMQVGDDSAHDPGGLRQDGARLLVVNKSASTLSIVDPATGREIAAIPTGFAPHEVAASADGRFAYVSDYGTGPRPGSTVTVIDLVAGRPVGTIAVGRHTRPHGITVAVCGRVGGRCWCRTRAATRSSRWTWRRGK